MKRILLTQLLGGLVRNSYKTVQGAGPRESVCLSAEFPIGPFSTAGGTTYVTSRTDETSSHRSAAQFVVDSVSVLLDITDINHSPRTTGLWLRALPSGISGDLEFSAVHQNWSASSEGLAHAIDRVVATYVEPFGMPPRATPEFTCVSVEWSSAT